MGNKTRPQTILINKVVKRDDANNITQIITDPSTVLEHTAETYKDWFGNRPINLGFKPQTPDEEYNMEIKRKWDDIYSKHPTDPEIYNHLMEPCTETEFLAHISQIPTKAGGESNITTPLIIKSPLLIKTLHALRQVDERSNNTNTKRSITTLGLQCYKYTTNHLSILTKRLTKILDQHNVIKGLNYSVLPNRTTDDVLFTIHNLMEDAKENNKELWIILQDMKRAFDSVDPAAQNHTLNYMNT